MERSVYLRGVFFALLTVFIWSGFIIVSRLGGKGLLTAFDVVALRFGVSGLALLPLLARRGLRTLTVPRLLALATTGGLGYSLLVYSAFRLAPAPHASIFLPGALPFETALVAFLLLGERPDRRKVVALSLMGAGIVGVAIDVFSGAGAGGELSWFGDLLFLAASSCWAFFTVLLRQWKVAPWDATIGVAVASILIYLPFYLLFLPKAVSLAPWSEIAMQGIYQGVLVVFVAMILYTRAVADIGASPVSLIMATEIGRAHV